MAKLADLKKTCQVLHLNPVPTKNSINKQTGEREKTLSIKDCIKAIQEYYIENRKRMGTYDPSIEEILKMDSPMLALQIKHLKKEQQDLIWKQDDESWVWEEKIDGCRCIITYSPALGFNIYSRNLSTTDQLPISYGQNILWPEMDLSELTFPFVIDSEIVPMNEEIDKSGAIVPVADTQQNLISAILSLNEQDSKAIQETNPVKFVAFDVISVNGKSVCNQPLRERKKILNVLYNHLSKLGFPIEFPLTRQPGESKQDFYNNILSRGGEGVVVKDLESLYETKGERSGAWAKIKRNISGSVMEMGLGDTVDAFVIDFEEGKPGTNNEGRVAALKFGIHLLGKNNELLVDQSGDPIIHHIATVSGLTDEFKDAVTTRDIFGNVALKQEVYGRVASIDGQDISSRTKRFMNAVLVCWRADRSADTCRIRQDILDKLVL